MGQPVEVDVNGSVVSDPSCRHQSRRETDTRVKVVYTVSPLSGDVKRGPQLARQACWYVISEETILFHPHLLYTRMLDDSNPKER